MNIEKQTETIIEDEPLHKNQSPKDIIVNNIVEINNSGKEDFNALRRIQTKLLLKIEEDIPNMNLQDTIKFFNQVKSTLHDYIELNNDLVKPNGQQQAFILQTNEQAQSGIEAFTKGLSTDDMKKLDDLVKAMASLKS